MRRARSTFTSNIVLVRPVGPHKDFGMPRRRKEHTFRWNIEYGQPHCPKGLKMTDHPEDFPSLSEKLRGRVTNEDLQATMVQILKSMEKISLETKGEVSRLCSLIRSLQSRLDLEYSSLRNDQAREIIRERSPEKETIIPIFPLLEEKKDRGKNKNEPRTSQSEV
ncbi:hypothetical protein ACFX2I_031119 [Malus domestica]